MHQLVCSISIVYLCFHVFNNVIDLNISFIPFEVLPFEQLCFVYDIIENILSTCITLGHRVSIS